MPLQPEEPRRIGRYRITGRVSGLAPAGGDIVAVFLAATGGGGTVLVTLLSSDRAAGAAGRDWFSAEADAARRVPPLCTARIVDAGFENRYPYLVSEFIPGPSLAEVATAEGPLAGARLLALAVGCATGLAAIHQAGLVHGHLRPETVVLTQDGPCLINFSVTPPYGAATPAADMLAWAQVVLFAAQGSAGRPRQAPAALPGSLKTVVAACLSPDPASRPAARAVLAELLGGAGTGAGLLATGRGSARQAAHAPVPPAPPPRRQAGRRASRPLVWAAAGTAVLILAAAAVLVHLRGAGPGPGPAQDRPPGSPSPHPGTPAPVIPDWLAGTWSGTVHQTNPVLSVPVTIRLAPGLRSGAVSYPSLHCSGTLTVTSAGLGRATVRQNIVTGRSRCENGLIALVAQPGGKLGYAFTQPGHPAGTLTRS
jgi:hypothetical protein